jgi:hypothetical protein
VIGKRIFLLFLLPAAVMVSCDSFFSATWGSKRSYDPANISLSVKDLDSWIERSIGNPELAAAVTGNILERINANPGSPEPVKFQEAGVSLAIEASGIGELIITHAAAAFGDIEEGGGEGIKDILGDIQKDFASGGPQAAKNLADIVGPSISDTDPNETPTFETSAYAAAAAPGDVSQAVLVLALAVLGNEGDIGGMVDGLAGGSMVAGLTLDSGKIEVGSSPSPEALALAAYLNLIAADTSGKFNDNPITGAIKSAFNLGN